MSMTMCDHRHEPVVYTDYDHRNKYHSCPVCKVLDKICEALDKIAELEEEIKELEEAE